jgi:hypothetical protein
VADVQLVEPLFEGAQGHREGLGFELLGGALPVTAFDAQLPEPDKPAGSNFEQGVIRLECDAVWLLHFKFAAGNHWQGEQAILFEQVGQTLFSVIVQIVGGDRRK